MKNTLKYNMAIGFRGNRKVNRLMGVLDNTSAFNFWKTAKTIRRVRLYNGVVRRVIARMKEGGLV